MKNKCFAQLLLVAIALSGLTACRCSCSDPIAVTEPRPGFTLEEITVRQLQQGYREGRFTVVEVVQGYLQRIEAIDRNGPKLNAVLRVNPDALTIAAELDGELKAGKNRGPLHGIPVILKDNIDRMRPDADDGRRHRAARFLRQKGQRGGRKTARRRGRHPGQGQHERVGQFPRQLFPRAAGAAWAARPAIPTCWTAIPAARARAPGVAVAANLCALAIGTETNGSIVCPANNNGIVGLKPTVGLVSRTGIIPISFTQDTAGPMGRTVEDVAICLGALAGVDESRRQDPGRAGTSFTPTTRCS